MNERERKLAIVVGALVIGGILYYGGGKIYKVFADRSDRIAELKDEIDTKETQQIRGMRARRLLTTYDERALPSDEFLANARYRDWLHEWVDNAEIRGADVKWVSKQTISVDKERAHDVHRFSVVCTGDLPQLVTLLYEFYSQDYLHRIKGLNARPLNDKTLSLNFTIEAIATPGVDDKTLEDMPSQRLALASLDDYFDVIVGRNLYSPANQPPKFASSNTQRGYVNRRMSFSPDVDDPESGSITYRVEHDGLEGLRIDERTGEVEWTPEEVGEFEIMVYATDDGIPAKVASQSIRLAVSEPPPEPEEDEPEPVRFDEAKYTFVTGIVEVNGRRQVWLTVRTDGTWLRLFEGETFQIGAMDGKVVKIHARSVEIESEDTLWSVRFGKSLYEGEMLSGEDVAAAGS